MADDIHNPGLNIECVNPKEKEECSKLTKLLSQDLHIGQLDSQGEEQVSSAIEESWGDDDPHIMLNASKVKCKEKMPSWLVGHVKKILVPIFLTGTYAWPGVDFSNSIWMGVV